MEKKERVAAYRIAFLKSTSSTRILGFLDALLAVAILDALLDRRAAIVGILELLHIGSKVNRVLHTSDTLKAVLKKVLTHFPSELEPA